MFAGRKIKIGAEEYTVPPLSLGQLRNGTLKLLQDHDALVAEGKPWEAMNIRGEVILSALKRNYPDIDEKMLFDWLDVGNSGEIWLTVLGMSGFMPGEAEAVKTAETGT